MDIAYMAKLRVCEPVAECFARLSTYPPYAKEYHLPRPSAASYADIVQFISLNSRGPRSTIKLSLMLKRDCRSRRQCAIACDEIRHVAVAFKLLDPAIR